MGIPENIKKLREVHGLTQTELGKIAGVSDKAISTWEKGTAEPRMGAVQKIADYFNIRKSEIIDEVDDIQTIAAHHDEEEWTQEELDEIEQFKAYVRSKRNK